MPRIVDADDETVSHIAPDPGLAKRPRLVAVWEGGSTSGILQAGGRVVLGRSLKADLRIGAAAVSREHATVYDGSPPQIEDNGSSNGTVVDGQKLGAGQRAPLHPGSMIELGDALVLLQAGQRTEAAESTGPGGETAMERLHRLVDLVASSTLPVILHGETGVGKEVMAERIHQRSGRASKPYVRINCAALAESMVESELFGHERGAFTGANQAKPGLLEAAAGGTVLLDEVTELSLPIQAKLLRALGSAEVMRVGSLKPTRIDVRFVAATNLDFAELIAYGKFRADLYFRLNGITLELPPLRERRSEIVQLATEFAVDASRRQGNSPARFSERAIRWMLEYEFPGNVRELKNLVERAVLLAQQGPIQPEHLAPDKTSIAVSQPRPLNPRRSLDSEPTIELESRPTAPPPPRSNPQNELRAELADLERER
ncbi:MAG TPA: sigma 54-interacting transcriptional regulator, partial [Polyangiaceae bacterium]|nr:sigma 54-interacting transcriptional regulator [Polyangiaceae bacterium]